MGQHQEQSRLTEARHHHQVVHAASYENGIDVPGPDQEAARQGVRDNQGQAGR